MKSKIVALILAVLTVFALFAGISFSDEVAYAEVYGGKDTADESTFWYYGENHLNVSAMKAEIATWDLSKAENPVVIAVVDTGVNATHSVFSTADVLYKKNGAVVGYNAYNAVANDKPTDAQLSAIDDDSSDGHGTTIASSMAILIKELGLEDYIKIYPIKASNTTKGQSMFKLEAVNNAIDYVLKDEAIGFDVVNLAMCSYEKEDWIKYQSKYIELSSKCVVVAAAGNGDNKNGYSTAEKLGYPASYNGVLSVMAYGTNGEKRASSNYGAYDVIAPGENVYTATGTDKTYRTSSGTSAASAFVSVVSAIVRLRSDIEGNDVNANVIASHIRKSYSTTIDFGDFKLKKFNAAKCVSDPFSDVYVEPNGISISDDGALSGDFTDLYKNRNTLISLSATLLPYGDTNPALDGTIVWTLTEVFTRVVEGTEDDEEPETEDYEGVPVIIGEGKTLSYKPEKAGKYIVKATVTVGDETFSDSKSFALHYTAYDSIAGDVEIVYVDDVMSENPARNDVIYADETKTFTMTYLDCVDSTVEVKWYVNGEYVASGNTFEFAPLKAGNYTITAQYGDYRKVENSFSIEVKSTILRPVYLACTIVGCAVVVAIVVTAAVLSSKKSAKRKSEND